MTVTAVQHKKTILYRWVQYIFFLYCTYLPSREQGHPCKWLNGGHKAVKRGVPLLVLNPERYSPYRFVAQHLLLREVLAEQRDGVF